MNLDKALELLVTDSSFAAISYLNVRESPAETLDNYLEFLRRLYWEEKNLYGVLTIGRAGIQFGLGASSGSQEDDQVTAIKRKTRSLAYNLASYTWPGWAEAGIEPGASDLEAGREAAWLYLRLVEEMQDGALPLARANWMVGAHLLSAGENALAGSKFDSSARRAREAGEEGEALLADGFSILSGLQASPGATDLVERLAEVRTLLKDQAHGEDFTIQIDTAGAVYGLNSN